MKKTIAITTIFLLIITICFAVVNNLNGKWTGPVMLPGNKPFQLSYNFKVDSGKLTGTALTPAGEVNITDGMINGDDFSFSVPVPNGSAPHTGKLYADSITLHIVYEGQHLAATLKRSN
ncbi:glycoside hydrolase [Mucilaginibacter sp. FT3.2]|uniref:glycoside hydrolase n=1 Tax=Mucilaginibacter sp. FT3.2 TaxID=2723090 RepID=UPI001608AF05|nr:glycoside hydrolase [Mucilaginibacter sp. FT3.2]MBB6229975.1 hypothetical protein [Mucilaginibacter sp. FT3.2]